MNGHITPELQEDMQQIGIGMALVRMVKAIAGLLAQQACIDQGINPERAEEYDRGKVRIEYGEPVPDEAIDPQTGATILRRALVIIEDKYLYAEVQLVLQPPSKTLKVRGLVGHRDYAEQLDPQHKFPIEWLVRAGDYEAGKRLF